MLWTRRSVSQTASANARGQAPRAQIFLVTLLLALLTPTASWAAPPTQLRARSGFSDSYRMPKGAHFGQGLPALSDSGALAQKLIVAGLGTEASGIWHEASPQSEAQIFALSENVIPSDLSFGHDGALSFEILNFGYYSEGVWRLDLASNLVSLLAESEGPGGELFFAGARVFENFMAFTLKRMPGSQSYVLRDDRDYIMLENAAANPKSPYSWLFAADFNSKGQIAAKARLGKAGELDERQGDVIIRETSPYEWQVVAQDRDSDPASEFQSFDNGVSLDESGRVLFTVTYPDKTRGIVVAEPHGQLRFVARSGLGDFKSLPYFYPSMDAEGRVAFLGVDASDRQALFAVGADGILRKLYAEGQLIESDKGPAFLKAFYDGPVLNSSGQMAFKALLTSPKGKDEEWGLALYVVDAFASSEGVSASRSSKTKHSPSK